MKEEISKLQNGSDIRGVAIEGVAGESVNLTPQNCCAIASTFASWLSKKTGKKTDSLKIGVGCDSRLSGPAIMNGVFAGLLKEGVNVFDCSMATTPAMFMSTVFDETKFDGAIMITASHLPFNRNGLKFFDRNGGLESSDIKKILEMTAAMPDEDFSNAKVSSDFSDVKKIDLISLYSSHLKKTILGGVKSDSEKPLSGLKIVVDAGNGAGGFFAGLLEELGADTKGSQFLEPDGKFPNHIPNPENKEAMESIRSAVLANKADLGLIFDTDVDRMSAVFPDGSEINRDAIIALISAILAPENPGGTIITDSVTSDRLTYFLEKELGLRHHRFKRGYKNVINECKRLNAEGILSPLAMETSGHGALKDNFYLDDGAFLAVKIVIALAKAKVEGKSLASLIEKLPQAVEGEEIEVRFKIKCEDFKSYGDCVLAEFKDRAEEKGLTLPESYEGVRVSFDSEEMKGWLLLRKSLHDPVMPLNIEGMRKGDAEKILKFAKELLPADLL